jgi:ribosomal protein S18 acetylase RimI-like enzyme
MILTPTGSRKSRSLNKANMRQIILLLLIVYLKDKTFECEAFSTTPIAPPILGIGSFLFRPRNLVVQQNQGDDTQLVDAANFFTLAFWAGKVGGTKELNPRQIKSLTASQTSEFRKRYGLRVGPDRRSELLVCYNGNKSNEIMGCAGIEVSKIQTPNGKSQPNLAPLMSNLAVGKQFRRKGVAEKLVIAAEELAKKQWGYDECFLYVEKRNTPALKLYKKLGYKQLWEDDTATTLTPKLDGSVVTAPTTIVCMKKDLGNGLAAWFPFK